jgi:hypothetical protein
VFLGVWILTGGVLLIPLCPIPILVFCLTPQAPLELRPCAVLRNLSPKGINSAPEIKPRTFQEGLKKKKKNPACGEMLR